MKNRHRVSQVVSKPYLLNERPAQAIKAGHSTGSARPKWIGVAENCPPAASRRPGLSKHRLWFMGNAQEDFDVS
jgi:hypothetical protein